MKKVSQIFLASLLAASTLTLTGCEFGGNKGSTESGETLDTATREIRQNDYRGGVIRTLALKDSVIEIMEGMKANNVIIRQDNPNSYWTTEGYQDFVSTFLATDIINDTQWFNEEETTWEEILTQIANTENSFSSLSKDGGALKSGVSITRNEKDDYIVSNVPIVFTKMLNNKIYKTSDVKANFRVLYDCDKDWCKAYSETSFDSKLFLKDNTLNLFEYQRIDNDTFVIQTEKERLMVVLASVETDTDIRAREVKEFYYSRLTSNGYRTTFEPFEPLPETDPITDTVLSANKTINDNMATYPYANRKGDLCDQYGENDSMFFRSPSDLTRDWVFEDKALQQGIVYKDGILVVTTYNKLSTYYERFIYSKTDADTSGLPVLEALVEIENLVGVQQVETKPAEIPDTSGSNTRGGTSDKTSKTNDDTSSEVDDENSTTDETSADDDASEENTSNDAE